jgi:3-phytase
MVGSVEFSVRGPVGPLLAVALVAACGGGQPPHRTSGQAAAAVEEPLRPAVVTQRVLEDSDDPAIWIAADDPSASLILGTDKHDTRGGVYVFGLDGAIDRRRSVVGLQRPNNVDVLQGAVLGGRRLDIAATTERNRLALRVFELPSMRAIDGGGMLVFDGDAERAPMGIALYRRPSDGAVYAFVGGKSGPAEGYIWQYRLTADADGTVRGTKVRSFGRFGGGREIEAIAVDHEHGFVYYSDETAGIRKYHADPDSSARELAFFGSDGFVRDHEGIAIYARDDGTGYIIVSDQQGHRIQVFPREGHDGDPHAHPVLAVIPVAARETDGVEVTAKPLGPTFPHGMLVLMSTDGTFHLYRWEDVEARLPARR